MEKIIIIGGRGTAIVIADQISDAQSRFGMKIEVLGLALDDKTGGPELGGYPILCNIKEAKEKYAPYNDVKFIYSLYRPDIMEERTKLLLDLRIPINKFINFIHPSVMLAKSAKMGYGNVLLANVVINCNAIIGNFNTINSMAILGHDCIIGNNNFFAACSSFGSRAVMKDKNFVGANSSLKNGITVGNNTIVGTLSNVLTDIPDYGIFYGNPARKAEKLNNIIQ